jgi:hypothetical protein
LKRQGNYIIVINIKRARLRQWNEEVKPKKPEQLANILISLQEQVDLKGLTASALLLEMLPSCKSP